MPSKLQNKALLVTLENAVLLSASIEASRENLDLGSLWGEVFRPCSLKVKSMGPPSPLKF